MQSQVVLLGTCVLTLDEMNSLLGPNVKEEPKCSDKNYRDVEFPAQCRYFICLFLEQIAGDYQVVVTYRL